MSLSAPKAIESLDAQADALAGAERRRVVLERLTGMGMALAQEIVKRAINSPYHPEPRHEPGRAFASVSRAVRLSVVLEARAEAEVIAIRKGEIAPGRLAGRGVTAPVNSQPAFEIVSKNTTHAKAPGAAREASSREVGNVDELRGENDRVHERLSESEEFDALLSRPWRDCIEAICADLGLSPDWSDGFDEVSFAPPGPGPLSDRPRNATFSPEAVDVGQSGPAHRTVSAEPAIAAPGQGPP